MRQACSCRFGIATVYLAQLTCFTSTKVQILTQKARCGRRVPVVPVLRQYTWALVGPKRGGHAALRDTRRVPFKFELGGASCKSAGAAGTKFTAQFTCFTSAKARALLVQKDDLKWEELAARAQLQLPERRCSRYEVYHSVYWRC